MPLFEYSGLNAAGKKVSGSVEGTGRRAVLQNLRSRGIFPTELREEKAAAPGRSAARLRLVRKVPIGELATATRQLATLLGAGLPLDEALGTVASQLEHERLARAYSTVRDEVTQGESLHDAFGRHPRIFPVLYVNMVQVGENTGTLDKVLQRLADFMEDQARMRSKINAAMAYPILMALIGTGVLFFLFAFVVPKVVRMLEDLGQALPLPTLVLISTSNFLAQWWWLLLTLLALGMFTLQRYASTEAGRLRLDRLALTFPLFGRLNLLVATARFTRTLGTLLRSGVPLLKALEITQNLMQNRVLRQAVEDTGAAVREGEGLAPPIRRSGVFPPMVAQMAAVGERSGELEDMLFRVADTYEHQVDMTLNGLLSMLEPVMILLMGGVVGFIVLAILLPIFQASQGMG
ncbi:type II secretion system inner membrane protein GspF [Desulfuromonas sp. TF]|uniref:type II secretion system inner membrane protein GspF n=1 Tax=Desulfuromonas sp. TF TaxID=1232410 RepID=UPI00042656EE|nr:type II secretion system inner membrane protein GspF [Desulfuromonas sp. TF]